MTKFFAALLAAAIATPSLAVSTVDVNNLLVGNGQGGRSSGTLYAGGIMQTWTVGTQGQLTRIDMLTAAYTNSAQLHPQERATLEIYDVSAFGAGVFFDLSNARLKGRAVMPLNAVRNGYVVAAVQTIDLSSLNITARKDQRLAFRMVVTCPGCVSESYWINYTSIDYRPDGRYTSDGYNGGTLLYNYGGTADQYASPGSQNLDLNFRTWMDASVAVPEPASWAMLIMGFGMAGTALRRRRATGRIVRATT